MLMEFNIETFFFLYSLKFISVNQRKLWSILDRLSIHYDEKSTLGGKGTYLHWACADHHTSITGRLYSKCIRIFWSSRNPTHFDQEINWALSFLFTPKAAVSLHSFVQCVYIYLIYVENYNFPSCVITVITDNHDLTEDMDEHTFKWRTNRTPAK